MLCGSSVGGGEKLRGGGGGGGGGGGDGGEAPFYSSNSPSPPLEYNPLSPDLQIMQRCSHFNWPVRH